MCVYPVVVDGEEIGKKYCASQIIDQRISESIHDFEDIENNSWIITLGATYREGNAPENNDFKILENNTQLISNFHCTFMYSPKNSCWFIKDGQYCGDEDRTQWIPSTNGTLINGGDIGENWHKLLSTDIVQVGETTLKFID